MKKENAFPVTFMMQPISFSVSDNHISSQSNERSDEPKKRTTNFFNSLELKSKDKQNYLKESLRDCN